MLADTQAVKEGVKQGGEKDAVWHSLPKWLIDKTEKSTPVKRCTLKPTCLMRLAVVCTVLMHQTQRVRVLILCRPQREQDTGTSVCSASALIPTKRCALVTVVPNPSFKYPMF